MNELNDGQLLDALKKVIADYAIQNYETENTGLLLSRLGQTIAEQHPELRDALGSRKLAEFITEELDGSVQVLTSPENRIVKIVLPASVQVSGDVKQLFPQRDTAIHPMGTPRYNRAFWAAFAQPLAVDRIRLVGFEPQVHFEDIEGAVPQETAKKIVPREFIVDEIIEPDPAKRSQRVVASIARWLHSNAIRAELVSAKASNELTSGKSVESQKESLLEILLTALGDADLKRIQMPLDVVAKLHRRQ